MATTFHTKGIKGIPWAYWLLLEVHRKYSSTSPLNDMLKKGLFSWNEAGKNAFERLKQAMMKPPILRMPNFEQDFVLECDVSGMGVGAVLMQDQHPIVTLSRPSRVELFNFQHMKKKKKC